MSMIIFAGDFHEDEWGETDQNAEAATEYVDCGVTGGQRGIKIISDSHVLPAGWIEAGVLAN